MTETTLSNYQKRAARTVNWLGSKAADGAHMALGITTELEELADAIKNNDFVNIREEHGDINWYVANECNIYEELDYVSLYETAMEYIYRNNIIQFKLCDLVDLHKREFAYGKEINVEDLFDELLALMQYLILTAKEHGFDFEGSLKINIDKLYQRFPDKFNQGDAINRDLKAEGEILKG